MQHKPDIQFLYLLMFLYSYRAHRLEMYLITETHMKAGAVDTQNTLQCALKSPVPCSTHPSQGSLVFLPITPRYLHPHLQTYSRKEEEDLGSRGWRRYSFGSEHELLQKDIHLATIDVLSRSVLIFRLAAKRRRKTWETGAGEDVHSGQNLDLHELAQKDIHLATINVLSRSALIFRLASERRRKAWEAGAGDRRYSFESEFEPP
jgi:hypothetical protein